MKDTVNIDLTYSQIINYAMQQNFIPLIKRLVLKNTSTENYRDIEIEIKAEPGFAHTWTARVDSLPPESSVELDQAVVRLSSDFLVHLTEKTLGTLTLSLKAGEDELCCTHYDVEILPYDQWSGMRVMPELVTAYITPNHPAIAQVLFKAGKVLKIWTGSPAFTGYQSNNPNTVKLQAAALYAALRSEGIIYTVPPASFESSGQRVRLCDNVLSKKMGTCLDLSLLYASCLEAVGLHALVIFIKGHAFAGVWLEEQCFPECVQDDPTLLTKRMAPGIHEICTVECTGFVSEKFLDFDEAVRLAEKNLADPALFQLFVDVKRSRGSGVRPLPLLADNPAAGASALSGQTTGDSITSSASEAVLPEDEETASPWQIKAPALLEIHDKVRTVSKLELTKRQNWERRLLDLSLRNPLLNFRVGKSAIQLMVKDLYALEDALSGGQEFQILARPKDFDQNLRDSKIYETETHSDMLASLTKAEFDNKRLRTFLDENEVALNLTGLYRQARVSLEENGSNTLYLALGFLKWYESDVSERERYSPLVLIPVDIVRKAAQKGFVLRIRDEDPQMNVTLLEMLRQDFGLTIEGLDPLPADEKGVDISRVFSLLRQAVLDKSRWEVEELVFLGLFSFSQFIMWNDLRNRSDDLITNKIVASLMSGKMEWEPESDFPSPEELDDRFRPSELAVPISADSSQLTAICGAGDDKSFVLHGPPGTGKSQTITNIIANALYQGKSVLFIAEKMAALSVVQRRLQAIGLAPFCLELHSNKARKRDVLSQLEETLNIGRFASPEDYEARAQRLYALREELNEVVDAVHRKREPGFSLYDCLTRFEQYRDLPECITFTSQQIKALTPDSYTSWQELISSLEVAGTECGGACGHPLAEWNVPAYTNALRQELISLAADFKTVLSSLPDLASTFSELINTVKPLTYGRLGTLAELGSLFIKLEHMPSSLPLYGELDLLGERLKETCQRGRTRDDAEKGLLTRFTPAILEFNESGARQALKAADEKWFLPKLLGRQRVLKALRANALKPSDIEGDSLEALLDEIAVYQGAQRDVKEQEGLFSPLYGLLWNAGRGDWNKLELVYTQALALNRLLGALSSNGSEKQESLRQVAHELLSDLSGFQNRSASLLKGLSEGFVKLEALKKVLSEKGGVDFARLTNTDTLLEELIQAAARWTEGLSGLRSWSSYLGVKERLREAGIAEAALAYEKGLLTEAQILPAFQRGLFMACANEWIDSDSRLNQFSGPLFENKVQRFNEITAEFERLTQNELAARLSAKIPVLSSNVANSSEIGILQKAIRSGGRMVSIRRLFDSIPNLLRKLCPCMLMSPISVAQYLDPKFPPFDLIVFDEASQLPTCEAVGAIARGRNLIVVGDPKQLPPTSFFNVNRVDEENFEQEDLESILDDCLALSMPQEHLLWHYRSRHESLIAFSNMHYYENRLFTFPSPNDHISEVVFVSVEGYYDRGKTKQNRGEAQAVVDEIVRRLSDPELRKLSIGVVTFSSVQQNLIDDLLQEAFAKNPELEEINTNSHEPLFIKNLENVQGDERDVILFSIGYGPDETGKVTLNFGPLNREGGWRRLNVVVSRARHRMMVFSALRPEQLDLSKTRAQGVEGLKAFLEYALHGRSALPAKISDGIPEAGALEGAIASQIEAMGYKVRTHIGRSRYRIDMGIVHPNEPGKYILGIMCDGRRYRSASTSRDRNLLQDSVLKTLGWNLYHIWLLDWWENPKKELDKVHAAVIKALEAEKAQKEAQVIPDNTKNASERAPALEERESEKEKLPEFRPDAMAYRSFPKADAASFALPETESYRECPLAPVDGGVEEFCQTQNTRLILFQMEQVMKQEAPLSKNLMLRRLLNAWGITRSGARLERRFSELLPLLNPLYTESGGNVFLWDKNRPPQDYVTFRTPADEESRRNMEDIPAEEVAGAVKYVLDIQMSLSRSDLLREVFKLFGFSRLSPAMEEVIEKGIDKALEKGFVTADDSGRIAIKAQ